MTRPGYDEIADNLRCPECDGEIEPETLECVDCGRELTATELRSQFDALDARMASEEDEDDEDMEGGVGGFILRFGQPLCPGRRGKEALRQRLYPYRDVRRRRVLSRSVPHRIGH